MSDGNLTEIPLSSVYSDVVAMRGIMLVLFVAELNELQSWVIDVVNDYLEAKTKEKACAIAGPEFEEIQWRVLVIQKALHGLRTSGIRWNERFADCLRKSGLFP